MFERAVTVEDIREVHATGETIEEYEHRGWRDNRRDGLRARFCPLGQRLQTEATVKCVICKHGEITPGTTTVTLERGKTTLVIKGVPARVCSNCGEEYVDEETTRQLLETAETAARTGVQVEVRQYAA